MFKKNGTLYAVMAVFVIVLLAFDLNAQTAGKQTDTTHSSEAVQSIRPENISSEIGKLMPELRRIRSVAEDEQEFWELDSLTRDGMAHIDSSSRKLREEIGELPINSLENKLSEWKSYDNLVKVFEKRLRNRIDIVNKEASFLNQTTVVWEKTKENILGSETSEKLVDNINSVLDSISILKKLLGRKIDELVDLQKDQAQLTQAIYEDTEIIESAINKSRLSLFQRNRPVVWNSFDSASTWNNFKISFRKGIKENSNVFKLYIEANPRQLIIHMVIFLLLVSLFYFIQYYRKKYSVASSNYQRQSQIIFANPILSSLPLALAVTIFIYSEPPLILSTIMLLFMIVPLYVIIPRLLPSSQLKLVIYVLISIFLLDILKILLPSASFYNRMVLILENIIQIWAFFNLYKHRDDLLRIAKFWGKVVYRISMPMTIILLVTLLANITGFLRFADYIVTATTKITYVGIIITLVVMIFDVLAVFFIDVRIKKGLDSEAGKTILKRLLRVIQIIGVLLWIRVILNNLGWYRPLLKWYNLLMDTSWVIGPHVEISVGGIISFIIVILITFLLSRWVRQFFMQPLVLRSKLPKGVPAAISMISRYIIVTFGVYIALSAAGVDLGKFGLIAGALGVGIGFGLQNVVYNFISGLIITLERPIHVGDTVEVGNLMGNVTEIGVRASKVKTFDGSEVIVPNGNLISKEVVNWTLSDQQRRLKILVKTEMGADPHQVLKIMGDEARKHPNTLSSPPPMVLFDGYGDSSLDFTLYFWVFFNYSFTTKSDVALAIYDALAKERIGMPVPNLNIKGNS